MGGGGLGGLASPRGAANALTRATAFCAFAFFFTSLVLGILAGRNSTAGTSILDALEQPTPAALEQAAPTPTSESPPPESNESVEKKAPSAPISE